MATVNQIGRTLSGATGTGTFSGATSSILVTPTLGVSTATSINFGGGALSTYSAGTWTPSFFFQNPGNLSVSYSTRIGRYVQIGDMQFVWMTLVFTPTYTTSSGRAEITGLPGTSSGSNDAWGTCGSSTVTFSAGRTYPLVLINSTSNIGKLYTAGTGVTNAQMGTTQFPNGVAKTLYFNISYKVQ